QAERFGSLQVDDQLERCRLLDREIGRLGALQDLVDVVGRDSEHVEDIWPIRHQRTGFGRSASTADRWQTVPQRGLGGEPYERRTRHYQRIAARAIGADQGLLVVVGRTVQLDCLERDAEA